LPSLQRRRLNGGVAERRGDGAVGRWGWEATKAAQLRARFAKRWQCCVAVERCSESRPSLRELTTEPAPTQSGHTVSRPPFIPVIHSASGTYGADGALMHYTIRPGVKAPAPGKPRLHKLSRNTEAAQAVSSRHCPGCSRARNAEPLSHACHCIFDAFLRGGQSPL